MKHFSHGLLTMFLASLLILIGCSRQAKQTDKPVKSDSFKEEFRKSPEDFNNRPIHKVLTAQIIDSTSDDELLMTVFDNLNAKLPKDYTKEYQTVAGWTKAQQAIYIIWWLEAEVNNGGYDQYYHNSSGQYADLAPGALQLIGAYKFAALTLRANEVYTKEKDRITRHQDGSMEGFSKSYEDNPLNKLDDEFYALYKKENLQQIQVDFIRKNKQDFIDE